MAVTSNTGHYILKWVNTVTPQEYITENSRWYVDSDCRRKLSGRGEAHLSTRIFDLNHKSTTALVLYGPSSSRYGINTWNSSKDEGGRGVGDVKWNENTDRFSPGNFLYVKNTGSHPIKVYFGTNWKLTLGTNECYCGMIDSQEVFTSTITVQPYTDGTEYECEYLMGA